ncbi:FtsL-like putative cell division protein [Hymenobacter persicinus]|uniref:FtsL-like putative cell division protein n=1 Tax=Hymenobacter persicinus TaxID=2025506 RepID=UPI001A92CDF9|nr:FtsL-like putative cell division protein [Hymenobacter persicinus]
MAINSPKPTVAAPPRANVPREVAPPLPEEPAFVPEPEPLPEPKVRAPKPPKAAKRSAWSVFTVLERFTRMDDLFREGLPVRYLPHVLFIMSLTLIYIGNTHWGNRMNRSIQKLRLETEDLRADYTTLKSDYMEASKQSEVARKVAAYGLVESSSPPFRITVPAGRLDEAELDMIPVLNADSLAAQAARDSAATADSVRALMPERPVHTLGASHAAPVKPKATAKKKKTTPARPAAKKANSTSNQSRHERKR